MRVSNTLIVLAGLCLFGFPMTCVAQEDTELPYVQFSFDAGGWLWLYLSSPDSSTDETPFISAVEDICETEDLETDRSTATRSGYFEVSAWSSWTAPMEDATRGVTLDIALVREAFQSVAAEKVEVWVELPPGNVREISWPLERQYDDGESTNYYGEIRMDEFPENLTVRFGIDREVYWQTARGGLLKFGLPFLLCLLLRVAASRVPDEDIGSFLVSFRIFAPICVVAYIATDIFLATDFDAFDALVSQEIVSPAYIGALRLSVSLPFFLIAMICYLAVVLPIWQRFPGFAYTARDFAVLCVTLWVGFCFASAVFSALQAFREHEPVWIWLVMCAATLPATMAMIPKCQRSFTYQFRTVSDNDFHERVREIAKQMGIAGSVLAYRLNMEKFAVANAFSYGPNLIGVTDKMLQTYPKEEVDAIIAHELAHIRYGHVGQQLVATMLLVAALLALPRLFFSDFFFDAGSELLSPEVSWLIVFVVPLAIIVFHYYLSRRREFAADALAAKVLDNPLNLGRALIRLSRDSRMTMRSPGLIARMFATHPTFERRIRALGFADPAALEIAESNDADCYSAVSADHDYLFDSAHRISIGTGYYWALAIGLSIFLIAITVGIERYFYDVPLFVVVAIATLSGAVALTIADTALSTRSFVKQRSTLSERLGIDFEYAHYVSLKPNEKDEFYDGFTNWDVGFLWFSDQTLCFRGERTSFELPLSSVISHRTGPSAKIAWMSLDWLWMQLTAGGETQTVGVMEIGGATGLQVKRRTRRLSEKLKRHLEETRSSGHGEVAIPTAWPDMKSENTATIDHPLAFGRLVNDKVYYAAAVASLLALMVGFPLTSWESMSALSIGLAAGLTYTISRVPAILYARRVSRNQGVKA